MFKNFTHVATVLIGIMVVALAWGISPVLPKPTSAEIATDRAEPPVFVTSAFKIVSQGGQVRTIISLWDGDSPFLAAEEGQRLPQWPCLTYKNNVTQLMIREIRDTREWPTNLHSMPNPGMGHEQSQMTCESTSSPRMKGRHGLSSSKGPITLLLSLHHSMNRAGRSLFSSANRREHDEHVFSIY